MINRDRPYNVARIRALLEDAFDDVGLKALCQDEFPKLDNKLSRGMRKDEIINVIIGHFLHKDFAPLLTAVKKREPELYTSFEASLVVLDEGFASKRLTERKRQAELPRDVTKVTVVLEGDYVSFTKTEQDGFIFALSRLLNVSAEQIRIWRVAPVGSFLVILEMPGQAAERFFSMFLAGAPELRTLGILKVELQTKEKGGEIVRSLVELLRAALQSIQPPKEEDERVSRRLQSTRAWEAAFLGILGFLTGVLGNLLAAWIQQDVLGNAFTPLRLSLILLLTALSIGAGVWTPRKYPIYAKSLSGMLVILLVSLTAFVTVITVPPVVTPMSTIITPSVPPLTPVTPPAETVTVMASPTPIPIATPTSTPDCSDVSVAYLELDLATGTGQRKDPDAKGVVILTPDDIGNLAALAGRAILTSTNAADCACAWEGWANKAGEWKPIGSVNCNFSIQISDAVDVVYLKLELGGEYYLFTLRVQ